MPEPRPEAPSLVSIQVGLPQTRGEAGATDPMHVQWTSAFVKEPAFGENFTVAGLDETIACLADTLEIGEAVVQVASQRKGARG